MRNIKKDKLEKIISDFPLINDDNLIENEALQYYRKYVILPYNFESWKQDIESEIVFYKENMNPEYSKLYFKYEGKLLDFMLDIYEKTPLISKIIGETIEEDEYYEGIDIDCFKNICLDSFREKTLFFLIAPEHNTIILGNYDLTLGIFIKKDISETDPISFFDKLALKNELTTNEL